MTSKAARRKPFKAGRGYSKEDWDAVSDNPEWTGKDIKGARPFAEALPDLMDGIRRARGRPRVESPKEAVTLRLDPSTLARFRSTGKDWRARMARALDRAKI